GIDRPIRARECQPEAFCPPGRRPAGGERHVGNRTGTVEEGEEPARVVGERRLLVEARLSAEALDPRGLRHEGPGGERAHGPEGDAVDRGGDRCEEPSADTGGGRDEAETAVDSQGGGGHATAIPRGARAAMMMRDDDTTRSLPSSGHRVVSGGED